MIVTFKLHARELDIAIGLLDLYGGSSTINVSKQTYVNNIRKPFISTGNYKSRCIIITIIMRYFSNVSGHYS